MGCGVLITLTGWYLLKPRIFVGDETEYFGTPATPPVWIRVAGHKALMSFSQRVFPLKNGGGARAATMAISLMSIAGAVWFVQGKVGGIGAMITAVILLSSLERMILALHLWPDIPMGALVLCTGILLMSGGAGIALAVIACLAVSIRIEAGALCLLASGLPLLFDDLTLARLSPALICLTGLAVLTGINRWQHGVWVLDSTVQFNLAVARKEAIRTGADVRTLMRETLNDHRTAATSHHRASIWRHIALVITRLKVLLGPETFVRQVLLEPNNPGYKNADLPLRAPWLWGLTHGFSAAVLLCLISVAYVPVPLLALFFGSSILYALVQSRSRYRMALFPLLAMCCGLGWAKAMADPDPLRLLFGVALAGVFMLFLRAIPMRYETNPVAASGSDSASGSASGMPPAAASGV